MSHLFDDTICALGEGPLWHPVRQQLFWFDIIGHKLLTREGETTRTVRFDEHVSAAGWVSESELLIASETRLFLWNIENESHRDVAALEEDNRVTRSNDGRADPFGGFWIGTMGKGAEPGAGAIYRYYRGELRTLYPEITISNAICFSPDGMTAYWTDTKVGKLMKQALNPGDGWPAGEAEVLIDLSGEEFGIDGAIVATDGTIWNAQWGASRVAVYGPDGAFVKSVSFGAKQTSCPAFGGTDLSTLFVTSAANGTPQTGSEGMTFAAKVDAKGQAEHQVIL